MVGGRMIVLVLGAFVIGCEIIDRLWGRETLQQIMEEVFPK